MKLGINTFALRWAAGGHLEFGNDFHVENPLDVFDLVGKVSELGLEVLEIGDNMNFDLPVEEYKKLGRYAKGKGVTLDLQLGGIDPSIVDKYAQIADLAGLRLLNLYPLKREPINILVERIRNDILPVLRDRGLTLTIENSHSYTEPYSCHEYADMFKQIDDPLVGACIDTMNSTGILENPLETVKVLLPYVVRIHLKDFMIKRKSVSSFVIFGVPVGKGMLDVEAILDLLKKSGRDPDIILEQWMGMSYNEEATLEEEERWVKESIRYVRSIL